MRAYEELEHAPTPFGDLLLVRRRVAGAPEGAAYEVKLGGALLMSSLVTESERALATLGLAASAARPKRVLVGGLGLGYTAAEVLRAPEVALLEVVELLPQVLDWHRRGLVPLGALLAGDPRCRLTHGDVFARLTEPPRADGRWDAILLDVDHTPDALLRPEHGAFYSQAGLKACARHLAPTGVFGLWSALAPDERFASRLATVFARVATHAVSFWNPNNDAEEVNGIYLAGDSLR